MLLVEAPKSRAASQSCSSPSQTQQTQSGQKIHGWIRDSLSDLSSWIIMDYGSGIAMDSLSPPQTLHPGSRQLVQWRSRPIGRSAHFTE